MRKEESFTGNVDWLTILLYLLLTLFGWLVIYSAVYTADSGSIFSSKINSGRQFQWIIFSLVIGFVILLIDSRFFATLAYPFLGLILLLSIAVLFFGAEKKGQKNWIIIGSFQMQPSELLKFGVSLGLAKYLSTLNIDLRNLRDKLYAMAFVVLPTLLILIQGDTGSAIVFVALVLVLFREGLEPIFLIVGVIIAVLSIMALALPKIWYLWLGLIVLGLLLSYFLYKKRNALVVIWTVIALSVGYSFAVSFMFQHLKQHQKDRINVLLGKETDKDLTWNVDQSKIAIGSGGIIGKGYLKGTQTKLKFVPEQSTDFIFSSIGEEFGFLGTTILIIVYVLFFFRLLQLAERQRSKFSRIYGYCVFSILFFHFAINIGMAIGIAPVIGIPLPFISYGGSSLLAFTILLFVFIKMDAQRYEVIR